MLCSIAELIPQASASRCCSLWSALWHTWLRKAPLRSSAECWSGAEKSISGPDFNGIEWVLVVYRRPLGLLARETLATQHYRRRFESRHRRLFDCHRPSIAELESACTLPRCYGTLFRIGRADECRWLLVFWLEHEMHFNASLLVSTPEESEFFCSTQTTLAHDTLQQASCYLCAGCRRRRRVLCSISRASVIAPGRCLLGLRRSAAFCRICLLFQYWQCISFDVGPLVVLRSSSSFPELIGVHAIPIHEVSIRVCYAICCNTPLWKECAL